MNLSSKWVAVLLALPMVSLYAPDAAAQFRFQDYAQTTFEEVNKASPPSSLPGIAVVAAVKKYKVGATFRGEVKPLAAESASVLDAWAKVLNISPANRALFSREIMVRQGERDYWLPIQEPVLEWLLKEVKAGGQADFYIMHAGSTPSGNVFVVNEFQSN